jgi:hypothetical protein
MQVFPPVVLKAGKTRRNNPTFAAVEHTTFVRRLQYRRQCAAGRMVRPASPTREQAADEETSPASITLRPDPDQSYGLLSRE